MIDYNYLQILIFCLFSTIFYIPDCDLEKLKLIADDSQYSNSVSQESSLLLGFYNSRVRARKTCNASLYLKTIFFVFFSLGYFFY